MKFYVKIPLIYSVLGLLYIFLSDNAIEFLGVDPDTITEMQTYKGTAFIVLTAFLLYLALYRNYRRVREKEIEIVKVYRSMSQGMQHILNNFLQKVLLWQNALKYEKADVKETEKVLESTVLETAEKIKEVCSIEEVSEDEITRRLYRRGRLK